MMLPVLLSRCVLNSQVCQLNFLWSAIQHAGRANGTTMPGSHPAGIALDRLRGCFSETIRNAAIASNRPFLSKTIIFGNLQSRIWISSSLLPQTWWIDIELGLANVAICWLPSSFYMSLSLHFIAPLMVSVTLITLIWTSPKSTAAIAFSHSLAVSIVGYHLPSTCFFPWKGTAFLSKRHS